jgi:pimeloyl-ACP methyl ester carboxylesterase
VARPLIGSFARLVQGDGYPHGLTREAYQGLIDKWVATWGTPKTLSVPLFVASRAKDPDFVRWDNRYERQCASPGTVRRLLELQFAIDVRDRLPHVTCPVVVAHRTGDPAILIEHGRYLAEQLGVPLVELPGIDHVPWHGDSEALLALARTLVTR